MSKLNQEETIDENKEARQKVGCFAWGLVPVALFVGCIALWVCFGPAMGLASIAGLILLVAVFLLIIVKVDARIAKKKEASE